MHLQIKSLRVLAGAAAIATAMTMIAPAQAQETSPETVAGATTVDTAGAKKLFDDGALFVDPRKDSDFKAGRILEAVHLDIAGKSTVLDEASLLKAASGDKAAPIVFYCNGIACLRSADAATMAAGWGFSNLYYYRDGYPAWKDAGLPIEQ